MGSVASPPPSGALTAWLTRRRKDLLALLKREERERTGTLPAPLRAYGRRFTLEFRAAPPVPCSGREVEAAAASADILLSADYHASPRPERTHLRWLGLLHRAGRPLTLALELVSSRHQRALDAFALGRVREAEFLRRIRFEREWGFAWPPYRRLLHRAVALGCRLIALDHPRRARGASVRERDRHAGGILAREAARHPQRAILVVAGEMHLAAPHLPRATRGACRRRGLQPRIVTVFHGSEALYFHLGRSGLEGRVGALALGADRYCLLEAAPWVRLLAHLHWLETQDPGPVAAEPEERVVAWTARTLAALAGIALPARLHAAEDLPAGRLPLAERVAWRAVGALERACGGDLQLTPEARALWVSLGRCLVDPPLGARPRNGLLLRRRDASPGASSRRSHYPDGLLPGSPGGPGAGGPAVGLALYRRLVEGRIDGAGIRAALLSLTQSSPSGS